MWCGVECVVRNLVKESALRSDRVSIMQSFFLYKKKKEDSKRKDVKLGKLRKARQ